MLISTARAEWVIAPDEIKSTPVAAIAAIVSRVTLPEASSGTLPAGHLNGFFHICKAHIIKHDDIGRWQQEPPAARQNCAPQLQPTKRAQLAAGFCNSRSNAAAGGNMIFLDKQGVKKPHAVIGAAAIANSLFFQHAPAGSRFAGIKQHGLIGLYFFHILPRQRCDAAQPLHEIKRRALAGQQRGKRALKFSQGLAFMHNSALFLQKTAGNSSRQKS